MKKLVKSTMTSLEMDEQAAFVASPFGLFYSAVLLLRVIRVSSLADHVSWPYF
jgi:hypothetical protein